MSKRIAGSVLDADDLFAEAVASMLKQQRNGADITHVNAYLISAMRNRVKDELKSPRSQVDHLEQLEQIDQIEAEPDPALARVDLMTEIALLHRALAKLPDDQRAVLEARYVHGKRPRELVTEFHRSTSAISMLLHRAKNGLKRTMLQLLLEENAHSRHCRQAAAGLPAVVKDAPPEHSDEHNHYVECARCRRVWARFGTFAAASSVGAVLVVSNVAFAPPSVAATAIPATEDSALAEPASSTPSLAARPARRAFHFAVASVIGTLLLVGAYLLWSARMQPSVPGSDFHVETSRPSASDVVYSVRLKVDTASTEGTVVEISASASALGVAGPPGWECRLGSGSVRCDGPRSNGSIDVDFTVTYGPKPDGRYTLTLRTTTPNGARVLGTATGMLSPTERVEVPHGE